MNIKSLIIGGVLVLVVVIGISLYLKSTNISKTKNVINNSEVFTSSEYAFSIPIPEGWSYEITNEKVGNASLAVELISGDKNIRLPIFVEQKSWDLVLQDARKNFKPEFIKETTLAGQSALAITEDKLLESNPDYFNYRIKHPNKSNTILLGTAASLKKGDTSPFYESIEKILNSINFK